MCEDSLDKHIGEMLSSSPRFKQILNSDTAKSVFVPREWTGIKGFPDLDLNFKPTFPESQDQIKTDQPQLVREC